MTDHLALACADLVREPPQDRTDRAFWRCHNALACWRQRWYQATGEPISDPRDAMSELAMWAGKQWHELIGRALVKEHGAILEVPVDWRPEVDLDGTADAVYDEHGMVVLVEVKSTHSFAYRRAEAEGPRPEHLVQAGLYALAPQIAASVVRMIYVDRASGAMRSWMIGLDDKRDELGGRTLRQAVRDELSALDVQGRRAEIPGRVLPGTGIISPDDVRAATCWQCRLCEYRTTCGGVA